MNHSNRPTRMRPRTKRRTDPPPILDRCFACGCTLDWRYITSVGTICGDCEGRD